MAESTLSLTADTIFEEVAFFLGYGRRKNQAAGLSASQEKDVLAACEAGYRRFLNAHDWAFMHPLTSLTAWATITGTEAGTSSGTTFDASGTPFVATVGAGHVITMDTSGNTYTIASRTSTSTVILGSSFDAGDSGDTFTISANGAYRLPDNVGGIYGPIRFQDNEGAWRFLEIYNEEIVGYQLQRSTSTGRPTMAALRPVVPTTAEGGRGQRHDLVVWRIPDSSYVFAFRITISPDKMAVGEYPYGYMTHAETLKAACVAEAEFLLQRQYGPAFARYQDFLNQSISRDAQEARSETVGLMYDPSVFEDDLHRRVDHSVTVGGQIAD